MLNVWPVDTIVRAFLSLPKYTVLLRASIHEGDVGDNVRCKLIGKGDSAIEEEKKKR